MASAEAAMMTPIGATLPVAAALGKSMGTLLGPSTATKMVYNQASKDGGGFETISSNPVALLRAMDIDHPVGALVLEALEGMEAAFGTGVTSLATLCGALSTACRHLQEEGVPRTSMLHGFRVAEGICVDVLRGLSVSTTRIAQEGRGTTNIVEARQRHQGHGARVSVDAPNKAEKACEQKTRDDTRASCRHKASVDEPNKVGEACQQKARGDIRRPGRHKTRRDGTRSPVSVPMLASLAAGLQHCAGCEQATAADHHERGPHTDAPGPTNLSLPATLALQALAALLATNASNHGSNPGGNFVPDLKRLRTRVVVGPEPGKSCVVPGAAMVEVAPWEKDAVQDVFVQRHCTREACSGEEDGVVEPLPRAIATISIAAVAVVLGDVSATAGASSAATSQTPVTQILRGGEALLNRSAGGGAAEESWAEERLHDLDRLGVDALVATGEVCAPLRQAFASYGILLLSGVSQGEAEAAGLAANATPVPSLDLLTSGDVGRGHQPDHRFEEGGDEALCDDGPQGTAEGDYYRHEVNEWQHHEWTGIAASLLEMGTIGDEQSTFVPRRDAREGLGLSNPDMVVLLHQRRGPAGRDGGGGDGGGVTISCARSQVEEEEGGRQGGETVYLPQSQVEEEDGEHQGGAPVSCPRSQGGEEEEEGGHHADVVVMLCGPLSCACEELRHRFWRVATRMTRALLEGVVLPGAGACEVACATSLELEALRLEEDNARDIEHVLPQQLYTPMVLRSVAAALDEVVSTCMVNAGYMGAVAMHRLSNAKKTARNHLDCERQHRNQLDRERPHRNQLDRKRPHQDLTSHPPVTTSGGQLACFFEWGFCPDLAVVSIPHMAAKPSSECLTKCEGGGPKCKGLPSPRCLVAGGGFGTGLEREGAVIVLDNYSAKVGYLKRAVALVGLLASTHGMLLPPPQPRDA